MRLLVLGGTVFLGRWIVESALMRDHEVGVFHRGRHNPDLFSGRVTRYLGDRAESLEPLRGGRWDVVVDTCGYLPSVVTRSAGALERAVDRYVFVSSISVYRDFDSVPTEESPVGELVDESVEEVTAETYGPLKAACEDRVREIFDDRSVIVRPGLIVGPNDASDRFTYWVRRLRRGGDVLVPGDPGRPVQFIDVRDLAGWIVQLAEGQAAGTYNATGPKTRLTMQEVIERCREVVGVNVDLHWVEDSFLVAKDLAPYTQIPLWLPPEIKYFNSVDCRRALGDGLAFRPLNATIRDTDDWDRERGDGVVLKAGLEARQEASLLREWRALT